MAKNNLFSATEPETAGQKDLHADRDLKTVAHHLHENISAWKEIKLHIFTKNFYSDHMQVNKSKWFHEPSAEYDLL